MTGYAEDIMLYEQGEMDEEDVPALFQALIDTGMAWKLQGSYGRTAMELIELGACTLGSEGHYDAYGNYVPSRDEVEPGSKGSVEYAARRDDA